MAGVLEFFKVDSMFEFWWIVFGLGGQLMFTARFIVQWIASERAGRSLVPVAFWYFSIGGGLILFMYAIYRADPVFILGQSMGLFIYTRNLWLIHSEKKQSASTGE